MSYRDTKSLHSLSQCHPHEENGKKKQQKHCMDCYHQKSCAKIKLGHAKTQAVKRNKYRFVECKPGGRCFIPPAFSASCYSPNVKIHA